MSEYLRTLGYMSWSWISSLSPARGEEGSLFFSNMQNHMRQLLRGIAQGLHTLVYVALGFLLSFDISVSEANLGITCYRF